MKKLDFNVAFAFALILKFLSCLILIHPLVALIYVCVFSLLYYVLKESNVFTVILLVMLDYISLFYIIGNQMGMSVNSIIITCVLFIMSNFVLYLTLINKIGKETSKKALNKKSNIYVDNGLKALENEDIILAETEFKNAIKSYKKNYLGYMGMCDVLSKRDKVNIKKIKYYKKKCIKYAPNELKENIVRRYE